MFMMSIPELPVIQHLYAEIAPGELFRLLQKNLGRKTHDGIYTPRVLLWMMMMQRLDGRGTLASSVEQLAQGQLDPLLSRCKRVREKNIALATGGYCQARQNLPKVLMERSVDEILQRLCNRVSEEKPEEDPAIYLVDGSSLQQDHHAELKRAYPPAPSRYGESHWPIMRIVVLQDVETGLARRPCWGPMYGPKAVSEQALAEAAMDPVPPGAVLIGDRNCGTFSMAYGIHLRGHSPLIRLTKQRAHKIMGGPISMAGDSEVEWKASRWDKAKHDELPANAAVRGRLIVRRIGHGKSKEWLYLFTTLTVPAEQVVAWYGKRWNVETDLRSLKRTVRLQHLSVQSVDMMEKELLAAVLAYNLVRAIMCLAAQTAGIEPRQLSFTYAYNIVQDGIGNVLAGSDTGEQILRLERIVHLVSQCRLPNRKKRRSFPREVWGRGQTFPSRGRKTK
jgi:hypothetical protein